LKGDSENAIQRRLREKQEQIVTLRIKIKRKQ